MNRFVRNGRTDIITKLITVDQYELIKKFEEFCLTPVRVVGLNWLFCYFSMPLKSGAVCLDFMKLP